ncbi:hypothetical protein F4604DRAFT_449245, partial [Suillus subluteus]
EHTDPTGTCFPSFLNSALSVRSQAVTVHLTPHLLYLTYVEHQLPALLREGSSRDIDGLRELASPSSAPRFRSTSNFLAISLSVSSTRLLCSSSRLRSSYFSSACSRRASSWSNSSSLCRSSAALLSRSLSSSSRRRCSSSSLCLCSVSNFNGSSCCFCSSASLFLSSSSSCCLLSSSAARGCASSALRFRESASSAAFRPPTISSLFISVAFLLLALLFVFWHCRYGRRGRRLVSEAVGRAFGYSCTGETVALLMLLPRSPVGFLPT